MGAELQLEAKELSPEFQNKLKLVLQGGLTLAQSGALAMKHMEYTKAAEEVRNARCRAQSRRQVQKGGVLYASEAREIVKCKEDTDVEKAERDLRRSLNAQKKANSDLYQPFLDEIKAKVKAMAKARCALQIQRRKTSRLIVSGIRKQARLRKLL